MNAFLLFLLLIDPKVEFQDHCKKCHESASILFGGKLQTKDLRKTIYDMYRVDSSEKPTKAQVDTMFKYSKSLKKK
jgi:serine protease inhibitor ecotin